MKRLKGWIKRCVPQNPDGREGLFSPLVEVAREDISKALDAGWQDPLIPERQYGLFVKKQIEDYRKGRPLEHFDALANILLDNIEGLAGKSLLEIGCSSGYFSQVLRIKGIAAEYQGCDYSDAFVGFARKLNPGTDFQRQDACSLSYPGGSFDIVVSGCCLLHIMDYKKAVSEAARVSKAHVVLHGTPVLHRKDTAYYIKTAYGIKMFEIHFNERELFRLMRENGLKVEDIVTFNMSASGTDDFLAYKTYLCGKN